MKLIHISIALLVGIFLGLGIYTFIYAEGFSYFSTNPKACVNCHVMSNQYEAWSKSGHHHVATCNDCHLGHSGFDKWYSKARNGFHHALAFTTGHFHEPIQISDFNKQRLLENCKRCHDTLTHEVEPENCIHCHKGVGHYPRF